MIRAVIRKYFQHANPRTVAPPGVPTSNGNKLPNIIVASKMRSGTHLAIDSILNNFPDYKRSPLYIDLDEYALRNLPIEGLTELGGYIIKTHYPQVLRDMPAGFEQLLDSAVIVIPERDNAEIQHSMSYFYESSAAEIEEGLARFDRYWKSRDAITMDFRSFNNLQTLIGFLNAIAARTGAIARPHVSMIPKLSRKIPLMGSKLMTRLLGRRSPLIITSISTGVTPAPAAAPHSRTASQSH